MVLGAEVVRYLILIQMLVADELSQVRNERHSCVVASGCIDRAVPSVGEMCISTY